MQFSELNKLKRFKDIVAILIKYGFDEIVQRMELPGTDYLRKISPVEKDMQLYERIRCATEELGPTFVKFGQILSLRPDLLPAALLEELSKLQDDVAPVEISQIQKVVEKAKNKLGELGEIIYYPIDHFDIYQGENFEQAVDDQLGFFRKHLLS